MTESTDCLRIAAEFRFTRADATWEEVAAAAGVSRMTLYRWRRSKAWEGTIQAVMAELSEVSPSPAGATHLDPTPLLGRASRRRVASGSDDLVAAPPGHH